MRHDFPAWLVAQGYGENTCNSRLSGIRKIERAYGTDLDDLISGGDLPSLLADLTYTKRDERQGKPNPSRFEINGNLFNGLATVKTAVMLYCRFLGLDAEVTDSLSPPLPDAPPILMADAPAVDLVVERQRLSLERDMQTALRKDISALESGLAIIDDGAERAVDTGFIDILARDREGAVVVIELKAGKTDARVIGQVLGYMGDIAVTDEPDALRGIIVAHEFDARTRAAARAVPNLRLMRYAVSFRFEPEE